MKTCISTTLFVTLAVILSAQPTITRGDLFGPGDEIFSVDVTIVPDAGPSGENVVWDFSSVQPDIEVFGQLAVLADTTPYFADYPQSNIALYTEALGTQVYQYSLVDNSAVQQMGSVIAGFTQEIFQDPATYITFPCTYNSQWDDDFAFTITFDVNPIVTTGEGSLEAVVDAYGTLILPHATFNDVLRIRIVENSSDSTDLGLGFAERNVNLDTSYHWISPSYYGPLCSRSKLIQQHYAYLITPDTVIVDVETINDASFTYDPMSGGSATQNVQPGRYALHVSPNPIAETVQVSFTTQQPGNMQFLLQDLRGMVIYRQTLNVQAGDNMVTLTLPEMPAGAYIAFLQSADGADVQKLIKMDGTR